MSLQELPGGFRHGGGVPLPAGILEERGEIHSSRSGSPAFSWRALAKSLVAASPLPDFMASSAAARRARDFTPGSETVSATSPTSFSPAGSPRRARSRAIWNLISSEGRPDPNSAISRAYQETSRLPLPEAAATRARLSRASLARRGSSSPAAQNSVVACSRLPEAAAASPRT